MADTATITRREERPQLLWAGGTVFDVVLGPEATGGGLSLLDQWGSRGDTTPMHVHRSEAEVFYVLEGTMRAFSGGSSHDLSAGTAIYLPAGQEHGFGILSERARILTVTTPGTFGDFVRAAAVPVDGEVPAQWEFDVARIMAAAGQHDIEITGPPPALT